MRYLLRFHDPCPRENGEREKKPTPDPSQEGNCGVPSKDLSSIPIGEGNNLRHYKICGFKFLVLTELTQETQQTRETQLSAALPVMH